MGKYAKDVKNAAKEVGRMAVAGGRGNLSTRQTVKIAAGRLADTVKGHGDQGRCSNGKSYCGSCPNCTAGQEWD